jgi:hypothetical protein
MNRFLDLVEAYDPQNADNINAAWELKWMLKDAGIPFSSKASNNQEIKIALKDLGYIIVQVTGFEKKGSLPEEEAEGIDASTGTYMVDNEVEKLANTASSGLKGQSAKLFGTSAQKAKSAVKKRQNIAKQAVDVYEKGTRSIEAGLRNVRQGAQNVRY